MVSELGSAVIILPLLAILENVAIAKAFCKYFINNNHFYVLFYEFLISIIVVVNSHQICKIPGG